MYNSLTINSVNNRPNGISFGAKPILFQVAKSFETKLLDKNIKNIDIYCHASPDEDTVNSMKVFAHWLKKYKKNISVCIKPEDTKNLFFIPSKYKIKKSSKNPDMALVVDFNGKERIPEQFKNMLPENIVGFDHHQDMQYPLNGTFYKDPSAKSCSSIIYRFFESLGKKLSTNDLKSLYCGMISDFEKSKLIALKDSKLIKLPELDVDKNSKEVLEKIESQLSSKDKDQIYKHLDIISNLTKKEKALQKRLQSDIKYTPNGKFAYVVIPPQDKQWKNLGMDTPRTSAILKNLRIETLNNTPSIQGVMVFYSANDCYKMSIHSRKDYAQKLRYYIMQNLNPNLIAGGHANRAGGHTSLKKTDIHKFIADFLTAAEKVQ